MNLLSDTIKHYYSVHTTAQVLWTHLVRLVGPWSQTNQIVKSKQFVGMTLQEYINGESEQSSLYIYDPYGN